MNSIAKFMKKRLALVENNKHEMLVFSRVLRDSISHFSVGWSVGPSVRRSVGPSVRRSVGPLVGP